VLAAPAGGGDTGRMVARPLAVPLAAALLATGCGHHARPPAPAPAPRDGVGTGTLAGTRFAVPPRVYVSICHPRRRFKCRLVELSVLMRLTRDIRVKHRSLTVADVELTGLDRGALPADGGELSHAFVDKLVPGCLSAGAGTDHPGEIRLPARAGDRIRVTVSEYSARDGGINLDGKVTGRLSTVVRMQAPPPPRAANDDRPPPQLVALGCAH
jgi:hypothetical protein